MQEKLNTNQKLQHYAKQLNIENNNNVFFQQVDYKVAYTVQPKGGGKDLHIKFESDAGVLLLDEIATAVLLKPIVKAQEAESVQTNEQLPQEVEQVKLEAEKLRAAPDKQGMDRLNSELLEEEQVQKTLSPVAKEHVSEQVSTPSLPPASTTKQAAPSFDCSKAKKPTDMTVCANPELVALDVKNMKHYKNAKAIDANTTKAIFKASIKSKYACGTAVDCIKKVYQQSILKYRCVAAGKEVECGADTASQ